MRTTRFWMWALLLAVAPAPAAAKEDPVLDDPVLEEPVLEEPVLEEAVLEDPVPQAAAFPHLGLLPKSETGAIRLLAQHPTYDGRGTVVAIFDTGVDPGAPGLQVTSTGKPKIVDIVDGSGSGDVDTSTTVKAKDGALKVLSGRILKLPAGWKNPSGTWHVGLKRAYDLYPRGLVRRLKAKRRKAWDERHREALVQARFALDAHGKKLAEEQRPDGKSNDATSPAPKHAGRSPSKKELRARLDMLTALGNKYDDPGPVFDAVVFHDGSAWQAVIDTDEDGALDDEKVMTHYRAKRQWATFSDESLLNYCFNIYDEGKLLSVVVDVGSHGTHVAGIVAAHFPNRPELNGLAPGAQIVSVKIGDTRQGASSMGTGEERGIAAVLRNRCDLINMSFGGASPSPNRTRHDLLYREVVNKHGVIFVASAGNDGPCLSTVGSPGGTNDAIFGVGAYVSPAMMRAQFSMRKSVPATHFTWSARGPTLDGALGVDFSAPGGAIAPVPNWSLRGLTQMNGTSMSAPNLCGNVAMLLSGMKAETMKISPHRVRRALTNTASEIESLTPMGAGAGLIQVDRAFEYLQKHKGHAHEDVWYDVRLLSEPGGRGIYLREPRHTARPREFRVMVEPKLHEDADHHLRVALDQRIRLVATQPWIDVGEHLLLVHGGRRFNVRVDPTAITTPGAHFGEVIGIDASDPERGPLFKIPVTVIKSHPRQQAAGTKYTWTLDSKPGDISRRFVVPPAGATWADVRITGGKQPTSKVFVMQAVQLLPSRSFQHRFVEEYMRLEEGQEVTHSFDVEAGHTLELAIAQYWSSLDDGACDVTLTFGGLVPEPREIVFGDGAALRSVDLTSPLARVRVAPEGNLTTLRRLVAPTKAKVRPLHKDRDMLPQNKLAHELVLTYAFELEEPASVKPRGPTELVDVVWEDWSSALWMLHDENDRVLANGPIWDDDRWVKLPKGSYTVRVQLRRDDPAPMKAWKSASMALDFKLAEPLSLSVHADTRTRAGIGRPDWGTGERRRLYVYAPARDDLPDFAKSGDVLIGTMHFGVDEPERAGVGQRPSGWPVRIPVWPAPADDDEDEDEEDDAEDKDDKAPVSAPYDDVRDGMVEQLKALRKDENDKAFDYLATYILATHPDHLPVLVEQLKFYDGEGTPEGSQRTKALQAASKILSVVDLSAVAQYFGTKHEDLKGTAKREHEKMLRQRAAIREALFRVTRMAKQDDTKTFLRQYDLLRGWVDIDDNRYRPLTLHRYSLRSEWAQALQLVGKLIKDEPTKRDHLEARVKLLEKLGWTHLLEADRAWLPLRFPTTKAPF